MRRRPRNTAACRCCARHASHMSRVSLPAAGAWARMMTFARCVATTECCGAASLPGGARVGGHDALASSCWQAADVAPALVWPASAFRPLTLRTGCSGHTPARSCMGPSLGANASTSGVAVCGGEVARARVHACRPPAGGGAWAGDRADLAIDAQGRPPPPRSPPRPQH